MTTYKDSGVDVAAGDAASGAAYKRATETFASRKSMLGAPVLEKGGFAGLLDMGDYYLVQTTDGTGTKMDLAAAMGRYDTLGYDLLAMVADDVVCTGAEVIAVSNCIDVPKVDAQMIDALMRGFSQACKKQKIVIPAGEIAEVPGAVTRGVWSASAIGIVAKDRVIRPETLEPGDTVISLRSAVARSNGFSLIRAILAKKYGQKWYAKQWKDGTTWGEVMLTPSVVYHAAVLALLGRFGQERRIPVKGIAHITGGGIPSKLRRILKKTGLGAELPDLWPPHDAIADLIALGNVPMEEAYRTWNMGNGMLMVVAEEHGNQTIQLLKKSGIDAKRAGVISKNPAIVFPAYGGEKLRYA